METNATRESWGWLGRWARWIGAWFQKPTTTAVVGPVPFASQARERERTAFASASRAVGAAIDDTMLGVMKSAERFPTDEQLARVRREIDEAYAFHSGRGDLETPAAFHRAPPALDAVEIRRRWFPGLPYEHVTFESEFEPHPDQAGAARWRSYVTNSIAHAWVLRHADAGRPWLVCLHGLGTGNPWMDFPGFRAATLHHRLGLNLVFPVLPLQGPRRSPGMERAALVSFDLVDTLHGITQAVWDARRLVRWIRAQGGSRIGVYGLSAGAYVASLVSGLEDLDLSMAGIPVCDLPQLFQSHSPAEMQSREDWSQAVWGKTEQLFRLISPSILAPRTPADRRFIFAGHADRITTPAQADRLWQAWDRCTIRWFDGGHVSYFWSGQVARFIDRVMAEAGFRAAPA